MKKSIKQSQLFIIFILFPLSIIAQKQTNNWYFGKNAGITFNTNPPSALTDGQLDTWEGCASISDISGNLLFYTDGSTIYNKSHTVMPHGTGLMGDASSSQSAIIIPHPTSLNLFYVFTVPASTTEGLRYSLIDMTLDGGLGDVNPSEKNVLLNENAMEKITAIYNPDKNEYWVISPQRYSNKILVYNISNTGVNMTPVESICSTLMESFNQSVGYLKIAPNSKKVAMTLGVDGIKLFDFDRDTGVLSDEITIPNVSFFIMPYGLEFSPNSKLLYVSYWNNQGIDQFNVSLNTQEQILDSRETIAMGTTHHFACLQLGPDQKIYIASDNSEYLDVINNPNQTGINSDFQLNAINLGGKICSSGLPSFIQSYFELPMIELDNYCFEEEANFWIEYIYDTENHQWDFGDPSSPTNFSTEENPIHTFSNPGTYQVKVSFTIQGLPYTYTKDIIIYETPEITEIEDIEICVNKNEASFFYTSEIELALLNGQENITISYFDEEGNQLPSPLPNPFESETQTITAILYNNLNEKCSSETSFELISYENPSIESIPNMDLCITNNELIEFDIVDYIEPYLNSYFENPFEISYFLNPENALNNIGNISPIIHVNQEQAVYIRIENTISNCFVITSFLIKTYESPILKEDVIFEFCDDDLDGLINFELHNLNNSLLENEDISNMQITYHLTLQNAETATGNLPSNFTTTENSQMLFVRAENIENPNCFSISYFFVEANEKPILEMEDSYIICNNDTLNLEIPDVYDNYLWSTGSTENTIEITEEGTYTVSVWNDISFDEKCETTKTFEVIHSEYAKLQEIKTQDWSINKNSIEILVSGNGNYEYSIDGENFYDDNEFSDLLVDDYTIYVRDKNGCGLISDEVFLIFYPSYFTPNGDGIHDFWQIYNNKELKKCNLYIYDRFGKLIEKIYPRGKGWDGTKNGIPLPASDYWFLFEKEGKKYRGNFTLKR
ncbi:T9SS type B sorting domain-containing protein [Aureivirga marina]|uniref:T9SS type B sorting domain-containing protein n=1 Tax=Aureivirga marina TaxID=1182451 RepID=UPI0018C95FA1|nr:T9SS type B sorting domain-containing protein [Aureivirga marina]